MGEMRHLKGRKQEWRGIQGVTIEVVSTAIDNLKDESSIWLYGIGRVGKKLCSFFETVGITVQGILVSDANNNPKRYNGIDVHPIARCLPDKNTLIIITVQGAAAQHIARDLDEYGYERYLIWNDKALREFWTSYPHQFIDRRKGMDKILFILSGYKHFLWTYVFDRVIRFLPEDVEVCLCSSGLFDEELNAVAEQNGWSYLSTEINSVTLIQNVAYSVYEDCTWFYKMDEDIFLTKDSLAKLHTAYIRASGTMPYHIGIMAPLIPLNEYGYRYVLQKYGCMDDFEERYGRAYFGGDGKIVNTPDIAPYMWGKYGTLPTIDEMATDFNTEEFTVCATRFNIGLILFKRSIWEDMNGFTVTGSKDLGADEEEMCAWCSVYSRAIMVTHDVVAGHFAFGCQGVVMNQYIKDFPKKFILCGRN